MFVCSLPASFAMTVALNSDMGLTWGFTRSAQNRADRLLRPDDRVLEGKTLRVTCV